jgi:hypothetical protein
LAVKKGYLTTGMLIVGALIIGILEARGFGVLEAFGSYMRMINELFPGAFSAIITALGGAVGFVVGRYLYDAYRKPVLEIIRADELVTPDHRWWRIIVKNKGRTGAEYCTGNIHIFGTDSRGNELDIKGSICWSIFENPSTLSINVGDEQALDVYRINIAQSIFQIPTELGWRAVRGQLQISDFIDPAQINIKIRVTARNAKPCEMTYKLIGQQNNVIMQRNTR